MPLLTSHSPFVRQNIRCFSTIVTQVPQKLIKAIERETKSFTEFNKITQFHRPAQDNLNHLAALSVDFLQQQEQKGCHESRAFLKALQLHRFDLDYRGLVLKGVPNEKVPAIYFSSVIGTITGHKFWDGPASESLKNMSIIHHKMELPFHTDFRNYGENLPDILTFLALSSDGKIQTHYINPQHLLNALSKESRDVLFQPIFMKRPDPEALSSNYTEEPFSIFYKDKKGDIRIFFQNTKNALIEAPESQVGQRAVAELTQILNNPDKNIIQSVGLKSQEMLVLKNDLHARSGTSSSVRDFLVSVFYEEQEFNFLPQCDVKSFSIHQLKEIPGLIIQL